MTRIRRGTLVLLAVLLTADAEAQRLTPRPPLQGTVSQTWKPVRRGDSNVVAIEVRTEIADIPDTVAKTFSLTTPIVYAGVTGIAERTQRLVVRDSDGDVPLRVEDDAADPSGFPFYRHWRALRPVNPPVLVSYDAITPTTLMRAPPFFLYSAYGGVSGAGSGFLVLPEGPLNVTTRVKWDLSDLAPGSTASTSFGDGDFELRGAPNDVMQGWIMAGPLGRYSSGGFTGVWLGTPSFDPAAEMAWTARMYEWLGTSYGYLRPLPPYRVFLRVGGRSGTALESSFMAGATPRAPGAAPSGESPRETFAHEMGHLFVGGIEAPQGVSSWFSEGVNTYYTRLLPMRGGFTSVEQYGREINEAFNDYWYGASRNFSADSIARIGFRDEAVRHMPYVRSSLYLADLDSKLRARSRGRRTLDQVLRELFEARARGERLDHERWIATVVRELGPSARAEFEDVILRGTATLVPASDAFGPCFSRRATPASVMDGKPKAAGYEWVRVRNMPDSACRAWGDSPTPRPLAARARSVATTKHTGTFGGVRVPYTSVVEEHVLRAPDGAPSAAIVTIGYLRDDVSDRARRPVTFVFNGGPGASSSPLHMSGIGPRLTSGDSTVPNPNSILDHTDLVFIDPVGTGFSRPFTTETGRRLYWTRSGDAASVAQAMRQWLRVHGRERSPRYLAGESYGTVRAAVMLRDAKDLRFDGVILVAVVTGGLRDDDGGDARYIDAVPTMAASAWFHGRGNRAAASVESVFDEAVAFADGDYRAALSKGASLAAEERDRVAQRMSALTGVPVDFVVAKNLRLSKDDWMLRVLADRGQRTGMLDTRVTAPRDTTRTGGLNDPSFNGGAMRFGVSMLAPALLQGDTAPPPFPRAPALEQYLKRDLAFRTLENYRSLNLDINVVWDHEGYGDVNAAFATAMREQPSLRMFWTGGYYDLTTPVHAVQRAFEQLGVPPGQTTAAIVPASHSVFADTESRRALADRLRAWIR